MRHGRTAPAREGEKARIQFMTSQNEAPSPGRLSVPTEGSPFMRLALEAGPLLIFFVVNRISGLMPATAVFMAATVLSIGYSYWRERRIPVMPLVGAVFVLLFGGLTLALEDEIFIKIKPTIVNLLFAAILFAGLAVKRPLLPLLMGSVLTLDRRGWTILTLRWACFFVVLAGLNEYVWRNYSTDVWAGFKLFGILPLTLIFAASQVPLIMRHQPEGAGETGE